MAEIIKPIVLDETVRELVQIFQNVGIIKGKDGVDGKDGADGYTPVKGTDYYTDSDKDEMVNSVKAAFEPEVQAINQTAEQAKNIAKGRATGYVFDTLEDLDTALTDSEFVANLVLGDNLYIRATDVPDYWWDGSQKQKLETEKPDLSGVVKDVQINGVTAVANGIANIPIASTAKLGAVRIGAQFNIGVNGILTLASGTQTFINERSRYNFPISTTNYDYAVKAAMCDGVGAEWTADEQLAARERIGAEKALGVWEDIATVTIEEAVTSFMVDKDDNGNPFSLSHVALECIIQAEEKATTRIVYFVNSKTASPSNAFSRIPAATNTASPVGISTYARIVSGRIFCESGIATGYDNRYQHAQAYAIFNGYGSVVAESFELICVFTFNDAFPVGTKLIIRGIRK